MGAYLRKATINDLDLLFEWVNDSAVRDNSFSTAKITYEEHQKWYQALLADDFCHQYIYLYDEEAVGQIRVTIVGETGEIGYSIRADKRNMGHGKQMLRLLFEQMKTDYPNVKKLVANVKPENIASQKVFTDLGYIETCRQFELAIC